MNKHPKLAIIGGSGLYDMPGLENKTEVNLSTPFGEPSSPIILGNLDGYPIAFLARHGIGHNISPSEINYRANIYALKSLNINRIISVSACGSLREDYAPGDIVIPDQLFDFTKNRERSFFTDGIVAHISVAEPFCPETSNFIFDAVKQTGATVHKGGSFITIEGPRFSTRAESNVFRSWGISIIGMTTSPEAFLAREAEICYSVMAHITDYDVWRISEEPVTVDQVVKILMQNLEVAQHAIRNLIKILPENRACDCQNALNNALITNHEVIPEKTKQRLKIFVNKYLN